MTEDTVNQVNGTPATTETAPAPVVTPATTTPEINDVARTRDQFEKLLDSNKRLFEANEALRKEMEGKKQSTQTFDSVTKQPSPQNALNVEDFVEVDPSTGNKFINDTKLKERLKEVQEKASRAEQVVQGYIRESENREVDRQNKEAFAEYPELKRDSGKFDEKFNRQVRGVLIDSMMNADEYGGRPLSFKEAADFVKGKVVDVKPAAVVPDESGQQAKEQGSAQVNQEVNPARQTLADDEELRGLQMKTRLGDTEALAKRLLGTEHILPKDAQLK